MATHILCTYIACNHNFPKLYHFLHVFHSNQVVPKGSSLEEIDVRGKHKILFLAVRSRCFMNYVSVLKYSLFNQIIFKLVYCMS